MKRVLLIIYDVVTSLIAYMVAIVIVLALLALATLFMSYVLYVWGGVKL